MSENDVELYLEDNETAHKMINECLMKIANRLKDIEEAVAEIPTPDKTYYRPKGDEEYLTLSQNLDKIYERLERLENGMQN